MNNESNQLPENNPTSPYYEGEIQKPRASYEPPMIYRHGRDLILCNGAALQSNVCIKTGHAAKNVLSIGLRSPFKPANWLGRGKKVMIGMDKKSMESYRIAQAVYLGLVGLGVVTILVGVSTALSSLFSGLLTVVFGLLLLVVALVIRSMSPIWSVSNRENRIRIRGCGEGYLKHFSEEAKS